MTKRPKSSDDIRAAKNYWKRFLHSTNNAMSRGASNIHRIITWARRDNWRRKNKKK